MRLSLVIPKLLLPASFLWVCLSHAQVYYKSRIITTRDGLSDKRVTCFYKDARGFMWIGTKNGLNRYDGHSFKVYRPEAGNSISSEVINDIAGDKEGNIWVATMEGLNWYDPVKDHWERLVPDPEHSNKNDIPNFVVWDIWFDQKGLLWIASDVFEFSSYDKSAKKFTYYDWPSFAGSEPGISKSRRYRSVQRLTPKNDHEFWLGTTAGLVSLDISKRAFRFIGGGYYADVHDLSYDAAAKKVYLSVQGGKTFLYDETGDSYSEILPEPEPYPSSSFIVPGKNELWMASEKGLIKIGDDRKNITLSSNILLLSASLLPGGVTAVYKDNTGIQWIGTPNGITMYDNTNLSAVFLPLLPISDKEGSNRMGSMCYDAMDDKYFVCSREPSVVFIISRRSGKIDKLTTDAAGEKFPGCFAVKMDRDNNIWLLTDMNVYRYDRMKDRFVWFPTPNKGALAGFREIEQDDAGNYWFASFSGSLYYYSKEEKRFTVPPDPAISRIRHITSLCYDSLHGMMWISTFSEGIYRYDLRSGTLEGYFESKKSPEYASLNLVNDIVSDEGGNIWVATYSGGIFRYNHGASYSNAFTRFDMKKGLNSNSYISLVNDSSFLWLLSGNGIAFMDTSGRFLSDVKEDKMFNFSTYSSDSRYPHDIFFNKRYKELMVAVSGGLLLYYPYSHRADVSFPVLLTHVNINNKELTTEATNQSSVYRIPFRSNSVSFEFAGLYYASSSGITYEYRLDGYDVGWINAGNNHIISYQNLAPGHYSLYVRAKDSNGNVAGESRAFTFRVVPPFWKTWWFIAATAVIAVVLLYRLIYSLRQKIKAEKALNEFATSLYGQHTIEDILWDTARNCIEKIGFTDCVIYLKEDARDMLVQAAAFGPKNPYRREILNKIEIPVGKGIVGSVAKTGKAEIIRNTGKDPRYILDDEKRLSEITVPVMVDGKVFAVIDSEHPKKHFFNRYHLWSLEKVAGICSERISKYLTEERLRSKIARDLHDEMGSTLTSINIVSKVAMEGGMADGQIKKYLQNIKDNSGRMMESMSDIVWAINPANDSFEKVILRMKEFAAEILEPVRINYFFSEEGPLEKTQLNLEQRKDIYMIFKEALNNAVKYSGATEINIIMQQKKDGLKMVITDNGNGFDAEKVHSGNGLKNMKTRGVAMRGLLRIESIKGAGTSVILDIPSHD
ncbi:MAG: GAF domain-containing protein [Chitinophagaceae bacterium]|nr:GAF domain-containing protein [Chitinophagaceae bacterium]